MCFAPGKSVMTSSVRKISPRFGSFDHRLGNGASLAVNDVVNDLRVYFEGESHAPRSTGWMGCAGVGRLFCRGELGLQRVHGAVVDLLVHRLVLAVVGLANGHRPDAKLLVLA